MKLGAQIFTVRDFCKDLEGFSQSLKKIAEIGYKTVQVSGTCAYEPQWLESELKKNGLECVLTHIAGDVLQADPVQVAKNHDIFGCKNIGLGIFHFNEEVEGSRVADFIKLYSPVAKALKDNGKYFMYHNHSGEFKKSGDKLILEKIAEAFLPDELGFTLDTYWVQAGGGDPAQWIEKLSGRVPVIHLKDFAFTINGQMMAPVGEGNINFDRVFEKAETSGTEYMVVEQDNCNGEDPFDCLRRSYEFLKSKGFE